MPGNVFEYCSSLDSIVIPAGVTTINSAQFNGCTGLKYIEFAEADTEIEVDNASGLQAKYTAGSGDAAVDYISTLEEVVVNRPMKSVQPAKNPWRGNTSIKKVTFGGNCTAVFSNMFENCSSLTEINIPETVTSIAANAFAGTGIASLDLHGGIATISSSAFQNCKNLTTVKLNEGTTFVDALAFNGSPVASLTLPESLTTIGKQAFQNTALTGDIVLPSKVARINDQAFAGNSAMATITLPAGTTQVTYYGVAWKNKPSKLEFSVGGSVVGTQELAANDGATSNSPYTITVADTDKYTFTLASALAAETVVTVKTVETGTRAILFGVQAK